MTDQVRAEHLLVKYCDSRNPVSRRTGESCANITYDEAVAEITQWQKSIVDGTITFKEAARRRSDCGSFAKGGDLGFFGPGEMMKPFEDGTRALQVGEISGIVKTDSGLHLIRRTA